jgi:serine/threonine-protein kinase
VPASVGTSSDEGRIFAGRFKIEYLLGKGGSGRVYAATQLSLGRRVAIKLLRRAKSTEESRLRFMREARTCARLAHPNIVTVHDFGETGDGELYMVMEYLLGEPLAQAIARAVRFPVERALPIAIEIARALAFAHHEGIVHRDLKAKNVMLVREGDAQETVKLLDFGLAKIEGDDLVLTRPGIAMGSPRYMAPEQITAGTIDTRSDIYALGALLFEMIAGRTPFVGSQRDVLEQHLVAPAPRLRTLVPVPPALDRTIAHCLEKRPDARLQSMAEVIEALCAIPTEDQAPSIGARASTEPTPKTEPPRAHTITAITSLLSRTAPLPGSGRTRAILSILAIAAGGLALLGFPGRVGSEERPIASSTFALAHDVRVCTRAGAPRDAETVADAIERSPRKTKLVRSIAHRALSVDDEHLPVLTSLDDAP